MVVDVINEYLKSNRRLVVPDFGAFLAKEGGEIVFSELLKRDDGVLTALLMAQGLSEIEAAGAVNRFIFEVRHDLQQAGIALVEGLGTFRRTEDGVIAFEHNKPVVIEPVTVAEPEVVAEPEIVAEPVAPKVTVTPTPIPPRRVAQPRKSNNFVMWFAGIVIAGALIALAYGLYCMWSAPERDLDAEMDAQRIPMIEIPQTTNN